MDALGFVIEAPATVEPWRKVLLDAATVGEREGVRLYPRGYLDPNTHGFGCTITLISTYGAHQDTREAMTRFAKFIGVQSTCEIATWNDAPGRTAAEVCAALRACAQS
jgi:hypothetical protein